jgi:hypothetical protein
MALRVVFEFSLSLQSSLNVSLWNRVFFGQRVRQNRHIPAMEKIQYSILHVALLRPKLVNAIPQKICRWPPQFVAGLAEQHDPCPAVGPGLGIHFSKLS